MEQKEYQRRTEILFKWQIQKLTIKLNVPKQSIIAILIPPNIKKFSNPFKIRYINHIAYLQYLSHNLEREPPRAFFPPQNTNEHSRTHASISYYTHTQREKATRRACERAVAPNNP